MLSDENCELNENLMRNHNGCCERQMNMTDSCNDNDCPRNKQREEMADQIKCLGFAITELGLYLDTHPDCQRAICMHRDYCRQLRDIQDKYQKIYGPLTIHYPCNKWRWIEMPWPWERGNY